MIGLRKLATALDSGLRALAALALALVVALVMASALGRYLFETPGRYIEELSGLLMVALLFVALAAPGREGHIRVGLIADRTTGALRLAFRIVALLVVLLLVGIFAWDAADQTLFNLQHGIKTELGGIPIWPWTLLMPLGLLILAIRTTIAFALGRDEATSARDGT